MKKATGIVLALALILAVFAGCDSGTAAGSSAATGSSSEAQQASSIPASQEAPKTDLGEISVVSREDGSGTRGAFIELFGIEQKNDAGEKVDMTTVEANFINSTSGMMATVAGDPAAIGYISLGSLNDTVKAVDIDGTPATVDNIKNGSYKVARPFNIATLATVDEATQDFIDYILSDDGQDVIEGAGYISETRTGPYVAGALSGRIVVAGSSSVTPAMEKLVEAYTALNPDVTVEIQQSDSSTGMTSTIDGICDIGMASRELKDSELENGLTPVVIAMDGIAVIVNQENPVDALTSGQVLDIFTGAVTGWADIG